MQIYARRKDKRVYHTPFSLVKYFFYFFNVDAGGLKRCRRGTTGSAHP